MSEQHAPWTQAPYSAVSQVYDVLMAEVFDERQQPLLEDTIDEFALEPGRWLDMACGTGTVAAYLTSFGWNVTGCDISPDMIARARDKAPSVDFTVGDMRGYKSDETFDVVSCLFDSINILTRKADLVRAFRSVARALRPGGLYLFDSVTPVHTQRLFEFCDQFHEGDGFFGAWEVRGVSARNIVEVVMRWFIQQGDGLFLRADETHRVRGYSFDEIEAALKEASLSVVAAYDGDEGFLEPVTDETPRVDFVARKD